MKKFDKGNEARRVARDKAAPAPPSRRIEDKRKRPLKHRKPLTEEQ